MNTRRGILLALLAFLLSRKTHAQEQRFPNVGLRLPRPAGFDVSKTFDGFEHVQSGASVVLFQIPGPFAQVTQGFEPAALKQQGMTLERRQNVTIEKQPGVLLDITQQAQGMTWKKTILAFGNAKQTFLLTASLPEEHAARLSLSVRKALLAVRLDTLAPQTLFQLTPTKNLKQARQIGTTLLYSHNGVFPAPDTASPIFVVAPSLGKPLVLEQKAFAHKRLLQTEQLKNIVIETHAPIRIDGKNGWETTARANDNQSNNPMAVYQALLFNDDGYILMQGLVGANQIKTYLPEFKALARSLRKTR